MIHFDYYVSDPQGIHARPAGVLAAKAKEFKAAASFTLDGRTANVRKVFQILSLSAKRGSTISVSVEGEDESEAAAAIRAILEEKL